MPSGRPTTLSFEYVILALLVAGPKHGYELYKEMEAWQGLSEVWKLKQSMLYADLNKLEKMGWVESMPPDLRYTPPRVNFEITKEGKAALEAWLTSPVPKPRDIRPEFLTKLLVASRFGRDYTQHLLEAQRMMVKRWIQFENSQAALGSALSPEALMVLDFRTHWLNNVSEWLEDCQKAFDQQKTDFD
ncbi:MAG: PadR family transcriptional regulator [Anaerolineaceae bacterium]|nr:PadR family transcriptional regulator [Anaerolineaceae bacterium]